MDIPKPDPKLLTHQISSAEDSPEAFHNVLTLSRSTFNPDTPEEDLPKQGQLTTWEKYMNSSNSSIFYVTNPASTSPDRPLGFFFMLPRIHPEIGSELLHIWLAGVHPESRGHGAFPLLLERAKQHPRQLGYEALTVCTFPRRFEKMYRILKGNGWEVVTWLKKDEKVLMRLSL